jgi:hypothetical protein
MKMVPVVREVFEYEMVPWVGREYAAWLRTCARPHAADPHRLVLIPERLYRVFEQREQRPGEHVTRAQLDAMQYPRLPDEDELEAAQLEQRLAAQTGDTRQVRELHQKVEELEERVTAARRALETWQRVDPATLEEQVAWELEHAPHADVLLGIPAEAHPA